MKWYMSLALLIAIGAGFYLHLMTFDPLTFVVVIVLLWNNHNLMLRQEQTAELIRKSHEVTAANQKSVLESLKTIMHRLKQL